MRAGRPGDVESFVDNQTAGIAASFFGPGPRSQQDLCLTSAAFEARTDEKGITPNGVGPTTAARAC